jgi:hypothetical protein
VVAIGVKTAVVNRNGNVVFNNGTSFSAPQIAGLAAGVWQANPDYTYLEVLEAIRLAGHQSQNANNQIGYGIPHYTAAKKLVLSVDDPQEDQDFLRLYPNPIGNQLFLITEVPLTTLTLFVHNNQGQKYLEDQLFNIPAYSEQPVNLPLLPSGVYMVTVLTEDFSGTYKLIKE